jgi:hypothetical protein
MSSESPADLAVAFRSFGRRLREAKAPVADDPALAARSPALADLERRLCDVVAAAAAELPGARPSADVATTGAAIADRIAATPADAWDGAQLDRLRRYALDAGRLLREIDAAARAAAD